MSSNKETTISSSINLLRPNEDGYQEWAEKALEIIRGKFGGYANYLKKKEIPQSETLIPQPPDAAQFPADYAVWKEQMTAIVAKTMKIKEQSPNVIGMLQALMSEESKLKLKENAHYERIVDESDVISFWKLIEKTHIGVETVNEEIQRIIEKINLKMVQVSNQSLSSYSEDCSKKIQRLEYMGCDLNQKELAVQYLLGLDKTIFSVKVGQCLSDRYAIPDTFQLTKEMMQNWYKGQVSAKAITFKNGNQKANKQTYDRDDAVSESISVAKENDVTCIYCKAKGHGAQKCRKLIKWCSKRDAREEIETQKANILFDDDFGC